ncbi:MAG: carbohydrate-binding domain-containing protein [Bacteroidaceae bacterium]|nr:carbohydrate-binding domain-containing protein [Bacteroidaceae bacterium]
MKRIYTLLSAIVLTLAVASQTLNVQVGSVTYQFPASQTGEMTYNNGSTLTVMGKTFNLSEISGMTVDDSEVTDNQVQIIYSGTTAAVHIAGNVAQYVTATVSGAHVTIDQSNTEAVNDDEITYQLSGTSTNGSLTMNGSYKCTVSLAGITLTNPAGAAINITNSKRIQLSAKKETVNTISDGSGSQKACIYSKGQLQIQGNGTLNVAGNCKHAIKSASYISVKNITLNITSAVSDGFSCEEYFQLKSGTVTISSTGDDCIQCDLGGTASTGETAEHANEDTGNVYIDGGTLNMTATADAAKGIKAAGDVRIADGTLSITQTGNIVAGDDDISYPTSVKSTGDIVITGGSVTIVNTAEGGKALSADGNISIDESNATTVIDITANGTGGTAETAGSSTGETSASYKVYISFQTSGGGGGPGGQSSSSWTNPVLYTSDGTKVASLTNTVSKSSGYSTVTFYYYDFKNADTSLTYYIQADSRSSWSGSYTPRTATFSAPTSGSDIWYSVSNSYSTSGSTRTYSLSNVTSTYGGTSDVSEDTGTSYNAAGIKADGNVTIDAGTVTVKNSGEMSKSIKSKATVTINGGELTFTPSGAMKVINSDASYSSAIKTVDYVQNGGSVTINASGQAGRGITATNITTNGGTLKITNSGAGVEGTNDNYTAKGLKADTSIKLNAGTITISMSGTGGKGIKSAGTYTQGTSDGNGPTLSVTTTGSALGSASSGGGMGPGGGGMPGQQSSGGSSAKGIKVQGTIYLYGGTSEVYTSTDGAEGLESKTAIYVEGGKHYFKCYDDCINSSGKIFFNGGTTVCYGYGNDAVDSNAGTTGAITIGNGTVFAYTTAGSPEEGLDCDNNSYIQITGTGIAISAGGAQGGGSSSSTISNAKQGYNFVTSSLSYSTGRYYTLADASGNNLVTYSFEASCSSTLALFTAKGMTSGSSYNVKYSTSAPTNATTAWHGLYLGSTATGTTSLTTFTAK